MTKYYVGDPASVEGPLSDSIEGAFKRWGRMKPNREGLAVYEVKRLTPLETYVLRGHIWYNSNQKSEVDPKTFEKYEWAAEALNKWTKERADRIGIQSIHFHQNPTSRTALYSSGNMEYREIVKETRYE